MARIWVVDDEPNERFTLYTRANVGEVFPHVMTALTGSLIGGPIQDGQTAVFLELGVLRPNEVTGPAVGTGVFGGYLYLSGSVFRLFGVRMPGMSAADVDEQILGETGDMPPYVRADGDRNLLATLNIARTVTTLLRRPDLKVFDQARASAEAWLATMPDLPTATDQELLDWLDTFGPRQSDSMAHLSRSAMFVGAPRGIIDRLLDRPGVEPGLANRMVGGTGDIDSARLAQRLWTLGRLVADDASLTAAFDVGLDGIAERTEASALRPALDAFLADHGHRCSNEYELAVPAWIMDPAPVYAAIDRLRSAPAERDPATVGRQLAGDADEALAEGLASVPRVVRPFLRRCVQVARLGSIGRERAKDILVLENLGARQVLAELVRRAAERGGPHDPALAFCVTADELSDFVTDPAHYADVIAERAEQQRYLSERVPPPWFDGQIPDPSTWALRADAAPDAPEAGAMLTGVAVSGGSAFGPARVISDPADPRGLDPGDVLVCAITDPAWTPLFLAAAAVVCETGAVQSHAAIVSRELGIPAVLSVAGITGITDGTMLHVDGDAGTVRIGD